MSKKSAKATDNLEIALSSFVRRTQNTKQLKELINSHKGTLIRQGRSRNWRLGLPFEHRQALINDIYQANESSWLWLAKKLAEYKVQYDQEDLLDIVKNSPSITINELMELTNCTIKEARLALDEYEWSQS